MTGVLAIAAAVVALDQFTKFIALNWLAPGVPVDVVDGVFSLTLVMNAGLAFGMLGGLPAAWRWLVALLSIVALLVLTRVAIRIMDESGGVGRVAVGLIFGGAVGNLIDRARFGAVVDFLDFYVRAWHWPAFNVADSAISVGVALLALRLVTHPAPRRAA
ncbi:MAG: signal peptidase II [Candidatus Rokubacteria bacterium]|nr:signal peptidase II [Candidatus Rokubacteria bacterium]